MTAPDQPLKQILEQNKGFGHREHVQLAWTYLRTLPPDEARAAMRRSIRHLAHAHDAPDRYHETLTLAWMDVVDLHLRDRPSDDSFADFIERNERLLDSRLLQRHYSPELLTSPQARREYVPPDLRRFPALA
ncbi:MAG TPA: hypothetical protein VG405_08325 [Solirubrobacteraceae bacterium]|jgi:hypothetical protein|nr:hypothetical protein [Solirubrobacteraceae bacterium]